MQTKQHHTNYAAILLLVFIVLLLLYLLAESWQRSEHIDKTLKDIPSNIHQ
jgi:hypothetical protein